MKLLHWWACTGVVGAVLSARLATAQFVELTGDIEVSDWFAKGIKSWTTGVHCVVGTNRWQMDGDFSSNARVTYRFTGTNIIQESVITKGFPEELLKQAHHPGFPAMTASPIGSRHSRVMPSRDGNPGRTVRQADYLDLVARIGWLAFCSGPCLQQEQRFVYPPGDLWKELIRASSFSDRTQVFEDTLGLPKTMDLWTPNNQTVMQYRVVSSTNIMGWEFPLEFYLVQYRPAPVPELPWLTAGTNGWEVQYFARGKVRTIGAAAEMPRSESPGESKPFPNR